MTDQQNDNHSPSSDPFDELLERNKHLKWPLIILFIAIVILVILLDIYLPNK